MSATAGIYVHIPFCLTRCGYCDFNAYAGLDGMKPRYLAALFQEAELAAPGWAGTDFVSVFLGGGTPTTMEPSDLRALLAHLHDRFELTPEAEVTTEANPDTVTEASLTELLEAGFARLSIGAQSFDPAVLRSLERIHQPTSVRAAVAAARRAGFRNLSLDLIYGANGESLESWRRTLDETVALGPEHVSAYALTIEPATALGRTVAAGEVPGPDPAPGDTPFAREPRPVRGEARAPHADHLPTGEPLLGVPGDRVRDLRGAGRCARRDHSVGGEASDRLGR